MRERQKTQRAIHNTRGGVLSVVIIAAIVAAIAAYGSLVAAVSYARRAALLRKKLPSRYIAEAGLVIAREKLFDKAKSGYPACPTGAPVVIPEQVDTDGDSIGDRDVEVTIECTAADKHTLTAKVSY